MRYLSDIVGDAQTAIFNKYGVFFAFSQEQKDERKQEGVTYVHAGRGMMVPKEHIEAVIKEMGEVWENGIKTDIEEHGKDRIILRELCNYECFYTGDIEDCVHALKEYGYTVEDILTVYRREYAAHTE